MTDVPSLSEVRPREGAQFEPLGIPTDQEVRMVGVPEIECASSMNRKVARQFADVHDIGAGIRESFIAERVPELQESF